MLCRGIKPGSTFHLRNKWVISFGEFSRSGLTIRLMAYGILIDKAECKFGQSVVFHITTNIRFEVSPYRQYNKIHAGVEVWENKYNSRSKVRWPIVGK